MFAASCRELQVRHGESVRGGLAACAPRKRSAIHHLMRLLFGPGHQSRFTFLRLSNDQRRQVRFLDQFGHFRDVFMLELRPLI